MIYHLLTPQQYAEFSSAQKQPDSLLSQGFIHLAYSHQVQVVIDNFFTEAPDLVLLELDLKLIKPWLKDEKPDGLKDDGEAYPHLYHSLESNMVVAVTQLSQPLVFVP